MHKNKKMNKQQSKGMNSCLLIVIGVLAFPIIYLLPLLFFEQKYHDNLAIAVGVLLAGSVSMSFIVVGIWRQIKKK
jgi:hypothetical protein